MDLISREAIKKYISAPCTYVEGRRIFYVEDLDLMSSPFDGKTNGEVIKALFPNEPMFEQTETCTYYGNMRFDAEWWNAPYKGVSE